MCIHGLHSPGYLGNYVYGPTIVYEQVITTNYEPASPCKAHNPGGLPHVVRGLSRVSGHNTPALRPVL